MKVELFIYGVMEVFCKFVFRVESWWEFLLEEIWGGIDDERICVIDG